MFILLFFYVLVLGFRFWFLSLNLGYLKRYGKTVPLEFEGVINPDLLGRISAYTFEKSRIGIVESVISSAVTIMFFFGGILGSYDRWVGSMSGSFLSGGLLFFLPLLYAELLIDIPFSLYRNFRIEKKYGFNTMSLGLWAADLAKSAVISTVLGGIVLAGALAIVRYSPAWWWLWVWMFFLAFGIFVMYLAPYVIEPLFFKFEPLKAEGLEDKVRELMERAGLKVSRVFQVDASRRSRHSNAYFTGIGRVKRIVLFDTLLTQMSHGEILAVLAHEIGHWKKRHVMKGIVLTETLALIGLFIAYRLVSWEGLPALTGLPAASFYARAFILGFAGTLAAFLLTPLFTAVSRRYESEADRFASALTGLPEELASSLIKLSSENLSNLHPHPLYAKFYYSHPPVVERIRKLNAGAGSPEPAVRRGVE
jgi:STE24 endopeptidase